MNPDEVEKYLPINKYTYTVQVNRIFDILNKIKPKSGNFLYWDIIGRIVWNASATAKSIERLIDLNDYYGASSLSRKLFEYNLLLSYLFRTKEKSKVIARIMAYDLFSQDENFNRSEALETVTTIVKGFNEDAIIIDQFEYYLERGPKHWHWSEKSFTNLIRMLQEDSTETQIGRELINHKIDMLKSYHRGAHVDLDLSKDYLQDTPEGDIEYISPLTHDKRKLLGTIGLARLMIQDIVNNVELELSKK